MFNINDYVIYKRDVCIIKDIYHNKLSNMDYYVLMPIDDDSLKIDVPILNRNGYLRNLITKEEVDKIIAKIPNIQIIETSDKLIENEYKKLLSTFKHEDLIKIIKTTYQRNKERIDNKKKTSDRDNNYFNEAEKSLYQEFSIVLGKSIEDTKKYVIERVEENI